jgi:hypothetical protein
MATINLGSIKFKWQGAYAGGTAYTVDDVVSYNGSSYICILASTGNLPTNATYWEQMSSAGTNGTDGTDLTTTLTTQGDIVYRDASGLARLGAGTSGQVLQTNGTGANPSWGTLSSDYVLLSSTTPSDANTMSIDGHFTSDYDVYKIYVIGACGRSMSGNRLSVRFNVSGTAASSNDYTFVAANFYQNSSTGFAPAMWTNAWQQTYMDVGYVTNATNSIARSDFEFTIYRPLDGNITNFQFDSMSWDGTGSFGKYNGAGNRQSTDVISGISIAPYQFGSGTLEVDNILVYGLKK